MCTTAASFTARNNAKRAAEKMIANGKAPAVDYGIRPRDDGRFEIVWKTVPTTGEVETEIATAATAAEDGHYSTNPRLSVNEDPSDASPSAGAEEVAAATGNEPAASSVPASGAPERDNKWPDRTRVIVRNREEHPLHFGQRIQPQRSSCGIGAQPQHRVPGFGGVDRPHHDRAHEQHRLARPCAAIEQCVALGGAQQTVIYVTLFGRQQTARTGILRRVCRVKRYAAGNALTVWRRSC